MASSAIPADPDESQSLLMARERVGVPDPRSLAVADSVLDSFAAELATVSITCGAMFPSRSQLVVLCQREDCE